MSRGRVAGTLRDSMTRGRELRKEEEGSKRGRKGRASDGNRTGRTVSVSGRSTGPPLGLLRASHFLFLPVPSLFPCPFPNHFQSPSPGLPSCP
eukprot:819768-Rhodomonas_salina.1